MTRTRKKYIVVDEYSLEKLVERVNEKQSAGAILVGGLSIAPLPETSEYSFLFCQAMLE